MTFDSVLLGRGDSVGLSFAGREIRFAELERRSNGVARLLEARGVRAGDRVGVYLQNSPELIEVFLAVLKLGVVLLPINVLYRETEIRHIVSDALPSVVIAEAPLAVDVPFIARSEITSVAATDERPRYAPSPDDAAAIVYTSGTTGRAKGAVLPRRALERNGRNLVDAWRFTAHDRLFLPLPLFHVHGLGNGLYCWLLSGCRLRLLERFDHRSAADELLRERPTVLFAVPTIYVRLLETGAEAAAQIGRNLRLAVSGSAALAPEVLTEFEEKFGQRILERYGMTETLMTLSNPYDGERRPGTVGTPLPGVSIRVVDDAGRELTSGEQGQLLVRSGTLFSHYWRDPEKTSAAFVDGWFRTGDVASVSADGYVTLHGRMSDLIITGGYNVYPREIEELLLTFDGVAECAVAGREDRIHGQVPVAWYVSERELDGEELKEFCRARLAYFKVPQRFIRVESLPRNAMGKIEKAKLL